MKPEDICRGYSESIVLRRWAATWIDLILFGVMFAGLMALLGERGVGSALAIGCLCVAIYYIVLEGKTGTTVGKLLCRLKVVDAEGNAPGYRKATVRTLVRFVEVNPLVAGGLPAGIAVLATRTRQRIGDLAAKTFVLRTEDLPLVNQPLAFHPAALSSYAQAAPAAPIDFDLSPANTPFGSPPVPQYPSQPAPYPAYRPAAPTRRSTPWALPGAIVLTVLAAATIMGGVRAYQAASRDGNPVTISFAEFARKQPKEGWYRITGCSFNLVDAAYETFEFGSGERSKSTDPSPDDIITDIYLPVFAADDEKRSRTSLVVSTDDKRLKTLMRDMIRAAADEKQLDKWMQIHASELLIEKDIVGTIKPEFLVPNETRAMLTAEPEGVVDRNCVVVEDGDRPFAFGPVAAVVMGVFAGVLAIAFWVLVLAGIISR